MEGLGMTTNRTSSLNAVVSGRAIMPWGCGWLLVDYNITGELEETPLPTGQPCGYATRHDWGWTSTLHTAITWLRGCK